VLAGEPATGARLVIEPAGNGPPGLEAAVRPARLRFDPARDPCGRGRAAALLRPAERPAAADPASAALLDLAARAAASEVTVLIEGPTGAGKEGLARFIHARSPRAAGPLVAINCAALPEAMLEAILFGHERGAFTGAAGDSLGLFRAAAGGTLLLDEVGELPLGLQAKLLRALQEREVLPVGATRAVRVDVRIIAATNRDLAGEVHAGRLREDLYWRLAVFPLAVPPLAERPADVAAIAAALLLRHGEPDGRWWPLPEAVSALERAPWPGNVRQLENVLQRALVMAGDDRIAPGHLALDAPSPVPLSPAEVARPARQALSEGVVRLSEVVRAREAAAIAEALAASGGRRIEAARRLGISERTLRYKLAQLDRAGALPLAAAALARAGAATATGTR
jgi:two-component system response regulator FlrC